MSCVKIEKLRDFDPSDQTATKNYVLTRPEEEKRKEKKNEQFLSVKKQRLQTSSPFLTVYKNFITQIYNKISVYLTATPFGTRKNIPHRFGTKASGRFLFFIYFF